MDFDVIVIGGGPAGLCFARALGVAEGAASASLRVAVVETQTESALAEPAFDGREIALTHFSARVLRELGLWERFAEGAVSPLRDARVLNGLSLRGMNIEHRHGNKEELGYLVSNHRIRRAAYEAVRASEHVTLITGVRVEDLRTDGDGGYVTLADGRTLGARLIVAADSRFSAARRAMGIPARMHDFGKTMMVCQVEHERSHDHVAWEWFDYGQTLALLPMNGERASVVLTLPQHEMQPLVAMTPEAFSEAITARFNRRLGAMRLTSTRHCYPLVTVYADRFVGQRFALMGDAAVGMHPVTAHGFNFGLKGADTLRRGIQKAHATGADFASNAVLRSYESAHRRATLPLFLATHTVAKLYTTESLPGRVLREAFLGLGERITPFKRLVAATLTGA
ncbi:MAG: 5-demethoxyubiquinol-8 5-hydroxylase UbiM [Burkholderiales bacterium]|nr:5-demethoxyubiquinol-8 5-hydroxylase UbiM [Burkholderiales bacterium]